MSGASQTTEQSCPQCGRRISVDRRFVPWCEHCDWNIEPASEEVDVTRAERDANAKGRRLFDELKRSPLRKPDLDGAGIAAFVIAIAIHAFTLAVFLAGAFILVTNFPGFFGFVVGGLLLVIAAIIRPRLGGIRSGTVLLPREAAPALYGLCDRVAGQLGAKSVDVIAFDARYNASHGQAGFARRRVLWVGLPLWNVLSDEERISLLAHELAHQVNGDLTYGTVVGSAVNTLIAWHNMLLPGRWQPGGGDSIFSFFETVAQLLARGLYLALRKLVDLLFDAEASLLYRSGQRAEYYADRVAAMAAGTTATLELLDAMHMGQACSLALLYAARREEANIWASERDFVRDFSPKEWERLRRRDALRGTAVDSTHPPTNLRVEMLKAGEPEPGTVNVSAEESSSIAAEMESAFQLVGQQVVSRLAG
jgi:Zn-dependent protease with chaperone function